MPNVPHYSHSLIQGFNLWILGWRLASLQWGWDVFNWAIEGCCVTNVNQVVDTRD